MGRLGVISDMDGVIYRGREPIPGAQEFIDRLRDTDTPFVFLTNNSEQTPLDLLRKLAALLNSPPQSRPIPASFSIAI